MSNKRFKLNLGCKLDWGIFGVTQYRIVIFFVRNSIVHISDWLMQFLLWILDSIAAAEANDNVVF